MSEIEELKQQVAELRAVLKAVVATKGPPLVGEVIGHDRGWKCAGCGAKALGNPEHEADCSWLVVKAFKE